MIDALANSGVVTSPYIYGGIGVALVVIAGFIFLFRRKARLQSQLEALQETYSTRTQEQFAVNIEDSAAPDETNDHQESDALTDQPPIETNGEQPVVDIAAMFRAAGSSLSEDESEKELEAVDENSNEDAQQQLEPAGENSNEDAQQQLEPADENSNEETQKQRSSQDAMLDLFATEVEEDDTVGKLAASLDNVDLNDIMSEAQSLINQLKGGK